MSNKKLSIGMRVIVPVLSMVLIGCAAAAPVTTQRPSRNNERVLWSEYPRVPSKDYTVVGIVTLREADPATLSTDLMEKAAAIGAHDIINIRVDVERLADRRRVVSASAVAIKYNDATLVIPAETPPYQQQPQQSQQSQQQRRGVLGIF